MWECKICRTKLEDIDETCWSCKGARSEVEMINIQKKSEDDVDTTPMDGELAEIESNKREQLSYHNKMAKASWILPVIAIVWVNFSKQNLNELTGKEAIFGVILMLGLCIFGLIFGIISLNQSKKLESKSIYKQGLIGTILSAIILTFLVWGFISGFNNARQQYSHIQDQFQQVYTTNFNNFSIN